MVQIFKGTNLIINIGSIFSSSLIGSNPEHDSRWRGQKLRTTKIKQSLAIDRNLLINDTDKRNKRDICKGISKDDEIPIQSHANIVPADNLMKRIYNSGRQY